MHTIKNLFIITHIGFFAMPIASFSRSASPKYSIDLNKINDMSNCYAHRNKIKRSTA